MEVKCSSKGPASHTLKLANSISPLPAIFQGPGGGAPITQESTWLLELIETQIPRDWASQDFRHTELGRTKISISLNLRGAESQVGKAGLELPR